MGGRGDNEGEDVVRIHWKFGICMLEPKTNCQEQIIILKDGIDVLAEIVIACTQTYGNLLEVFKESRAWYVPKLTKYLGDIPLFIKRSTSNVLRE